MARYFYAIYGVGGTFSVSSSFLNNMPCSISCWVMPAEMPGSGYASPVSKYSPSTEWICTYGASGVFCYNSAWTTGIGGAPGVGVGTHLGYIINSSASRVFKNGVFLGVVNPGAAGAASGAVRIGGRNDGADLVKGHICEVAVWAGTLTDAEMGAAGRHVSPRIIRPGALRAYWPLWGVVDNPPETDFGPNKLHVYTGGETIGKTRSFAGSPMAL